jgi:hypothetical protein
MRRIKNIVIPPLVIILQHDLGEDMMETSMRSIWGIKQR